MEACRTWSNSYHGHVRNMCVELNLFTFKMEVLLYGGRRFEFVHQRHLSWDAICLNSTMYLAERSSQHQGFVCGLGLSLHLEGVGQRSGHPQSPSTGNQLKLNEVLTCLSGTLSLVVLSAK